MKTENPWVSIIITTCNRPDYLRQAIVSAREQTFSNCEIIVVDDASAQPIEALVRSIDPTIQYLRQDHTMGANFARNAGVRLARGRYIACLDDDDIWLPYKLELQLQVIGDAPACLCGYEYLDTGKPIVRPVQDITADLLRRGNGFCGMSGLLCEREWLLHHPFDETLKNGQDWDMFIRLVHDAPIPYVARPLFRYRRGQHASITTRIKSLQAEHFKSRLEVAHKHRQWLGEHYYRRRIAMTILAYFGARPQRIKLVFFALRESGLQATISVLMEKFSNYLKRGGTATTH